MLPCIFLYDTMLKFLYAITMLFSVCYHVGEENNDNAEDVEGLVVGESESGEKGSKRQSRGRSK